ncbi:MAG: response regulator transcription factor [Chitinophagales bacterium]|nr:response regulator transcription factor [Chitinophagales bacterium]
METPIKVLVFDDNKRIRDSLEILFTSHTGFEWLGSYMNASEATDQVEIHSPDVVLMDIEMPGINGIEATQDIKREHPEQAIIMLTTFDDDEKVFDAICAGASGYVLKSRPLTDLIDAVKDVHMGGVPMTPSIARKMLDLFKQKNAPLKAEEFELTYREKEVLKHLVNGSSYKMIADNLKVSYETVHSHIKNIYKKLHVNSVSAAVSTALRHRL